MGIQFKSTKCFREDLTLVFKDAQCFNSILEPSSEIRKTRYWYIVCKLPELVARLSFSFCFASNVLLLIKYFEYVEETPGQRLRPKNSKQTNQREGTPCNQPE